jgi:hypothetical protein
MANAEDSLVAIASPINDLVTLQRSMGDSESRYSFAPQASHEFPSSERLDFRGAEFKPLAVSSSSLESLMPIRFYADEVISANHMHCVRFLGKLNRKLALPAPQGVAPSDLEGYRRFL